MYITASLYILLSRLVLMRQLTPSTKDSDAIPSLLSQRAFACLKVSLAKVGILPQAFNAQIEN
jgi:hypothetical protein